MENKIKVLVTGSNGFVGKNLIAEMHHKKEIIVYECDVNTQASQLEEYCKDCQFVFHLAGINRPQNTEEFMTGNFGFTTTLVEDLLKYNNRSPILMSSSIQAELPNDYGISKKAGEDYLLAYGKQYGVPIYVYRLPNVFGKWCRPNYNSVIATFCYNIAHGLEIKVNNRETMLTLVYIDDVVQSFIQALQHAEFDSDGYCKVSKTYQATLGQISDMLHSFFESRTNLFVPNLQNELEKKLYSTYLSYLPENAFSYPLKMNVDHRGSFTEIIKSVGSGQVSVNISKPHIVKGNHWHHTKNEKFIVVSGTGVIRFRKLDCTEVQEYYVNGEKLEVVDIPCGYTHNIENLGDTDMVTIMWVNEVFDPEHPDTFYLEV